MRGRRSLTQLLAAATVATVIAGPAPALAPAAASASVTPLTASLEGGGFSEFSQTNALRGTLGLTEARAFDGKASARATYEGGGENGYTRGIWNVNWEEGDDVWFGAAYYLPAGFFSRVEGQVDLLRWDNWSLYPNDTDWGGVSIYGSDHRARLLRFGDGRPNDTLVGPLTLPEGRWFTLEVHQVRSSQNGTALSELYLDGKLAGISTAANTYGRPATRVRFGLVAIAAGTQVKPLELNFDDAAVGSIAAPSLIGQQEPAPEGPAPEATTALTASLESGGFSEFSGTNVLRGMLSTTAVRSFDGAFSARATYAGGGENGYSRAVWGVDWEEGDDVWYGAAYYLPIGFFSRVEGQVDLLRWDNWSLYPEEADWGGVSIYGSDHRARLLRFGDGRPNDTLVGPVTLPVGRWFTLEVHQVRSSQNGTALSELYVDGNLVGISTAANTYGRPATRVRYGIVAIQAGTQQQALSLNFDAANAAW